MGMLKDLIGFVLIYLAFFNPLNLDLPIRLILFLLGFDLMSFLPKIVVFLFDYFLGFSGLGILLIFLLFADIVARVIFKGLAAIGKPIIIFFLLYFISPNFAMNLAASMINFLINLSTLIK